MNNKGFAVSSVLYAILICFLMFLGAAMAMFSSSNSIVVAANDDIINGTKFNAVEVISDSSICEGNTFIPTKFTNNILVKINSRYGTKYWPRDFVGNMSGNISYSVEPTKDIENIINDLNSSNVTLTFKDEINDEEVQVELKNPCK